MRGCSRPLEAASRLAQVRLVTRSKGTARQVRHFRPSPGSKQSCGMWVIVSTGNDRKRTGELQEIRRKNARKRHRHPGLASLQRGAAGAAEIERRAGHETLGDMRTPTLTADQCPSQRRAQVVTVTHTAKTIRSAGQRSTQDIRGGPQGQHSQGRASSPDLR